MKAADVLVALCVQFALLSLLAFGGANSVVPEMHRQAVDVHHWMTGSQFAALFAIAQAAPGPNFMISTLVGWKAAGLAGALIATVAMCGPSCVLTFWVVKVWDRSQDARWRRLATATLGPLTVGLVTATAYLLIRGADRDWRLALVTVTVAAIAYRSKLNPLWLLGGAAGLGLTGLLT
jgi:chromate transporter